MFPKVLITGCSGGGKSTLLDALRGRGFDGVEEPGRRIIADERGSGGAALPWVDAAAFARRAVTMARADLERAIAAKGPVFFDRGLIDAAVALQHTTGTALIDTLGTMRHYHRTVFFAPPWPALFHNDCDRRHDFSAARDETDRLERALSQLNYHSCVLPRLPVQERVDFLLERLERDMRTGMAP